MSPGMEIAVSAAAGAAVLALPAAIRLVRAGEAQDWRPFAFSLPAAAFFGVSIFDQIHEGGLSRTGRLVRGGAILVFCLAGLIVSVRTLLANWHDEEALADWYGSNEGYIPKPQKLPSRIKALLWLLLFAGLSVAIVITYIHFLLAPEGM